MVNIEGQSPNKHSTQTMQEQRSTCPLAHSLKLFGDKWTLLVIRDLMFFNKSTYKEFENSKEKIPTSVLANRLSRLLDEEIVIREPYQTNPVRYKYLLTKKGRALAPVVLAIVEWGKDYLDTPVSL